MLTKQKISLFDKTGNQINVIHPYKTPQGVWVFDDPEVELVQEPFVAGVPEIIESFVGEETSFTAYISHSPMAEQNLVLINIDGETSEEVNEKIAFKGYYQLEDTDMIGWLCPATLKYFKEYPSKIYVNIQIKKNDNK